MPPPEPRNPERAFSLAESGHVVPRETARDVGARTGRQPHVRRRSLAFRRGTGPFGRLARRRHRARRHRRDHVGRRCVDRTARLAHVPVRGVGSERPRGRRTRGQSNGGLSRRAVVRHHTEHGPVRSDGPCGGSRRVGTVARSTGVRCRTHRTGRLEIREHRADGGGAGGTPRFRHHTVGRRCRPRSGLGSRARPHLAHGGRLPICSLRRRTRRIGWGTHDRRRGRRRLPHSA